MGAFGAFLLTLIKGKLSWKQFGDSLSDTGKTTAMVFLILIGAMLIGYFLTLTRIPFALSDWVADLHVNRYVVLALIIGIYLFLGCIMDSLSMIILTIPIFFPVIQKLGFDPIWFGIIVVRISEIGLITPPIGMNVFIIKGVAPDVPMYTIFRGIFPFLIADICHVALLVAFPQISLFLLRLLG
jgi:tripartite ATP-independent transporter DctM subunit